MDEICNTLFTKKENKEICSKKILPIKSETIELFFKKYLQESDFTFGRTIPYISLISDNASNELQIYIRQYDFDKKEVTISNIGLKTKYFYKHDNGGYNFINNHI